MENRYETHYRRIREEERHAMERRRAEAFRAVPELMALDQQRSALMKDVGLRRIGYADAKKRLDEITWDERKLIKAAGLPADMLEPHYRCAACRDTGFVGDPIRQPCACRLLLREETDTKSATINDRETFEAFRTDIYDSELQLKRTLAAKKRLELYADTLPHPEKPNVLLLGESGIGKSFLGNAVCHRATERGVDTVRVTAYRMLQDVMSDFRGNTANAERFMRVPFLSIDDLGVEPNIPNVSEEWLFAIVNERAMHALATMITTNLGLEQLKTRYGERVMGRMVDKNTTQAILLTGKNLRVQ